MYRKIILAGILVTPMAALADSDLNGYSEINLNGIRWTSDLNNGDYDSRDSFIGLQGRKQLEGEDCCDGWIGGRIESYVDIGGMGNFELRQAYVSVGGENRGQLDLGTRETTYYQTGAAVDPYYRSGIDHRDLNLQSEFHLSYGGIKENYLHYTTPDLFVPGLTSNIGKTYNDTEREPNIDFGIQYQSPSLSAYLQGSHVQYVGSTPTEIGIHETVYKVGASYDLGKNFSLPLDTFKLGVQYEAVEDLYEELRPLSGSLSVPLTIDGGNYSVLSAKLGGFDLGTGKIGQIAERLDVGISLGAQDDWSESWSVGLGIDCGKYLDIVLGYGEIQGDTGIAAVDDSIDDEVATAGLHMAFSF
jgi:hypothetical protein